MDGNTINHDILGVKTTSAITVPKSCLIAAGPTCY